MLLLKSIHAFINTHAQRAPSKDAETEKTKETGNTQQ